MIRQNRRAKHVVLITGGTSGIGMALAEAFLAQGDAVAVCGRSEAGLDRFSRAHPTALAIQADVTISEARMAMLKGRPTGLVDSHPGEYDGCPVRRGHRPRAR